ncbi:MAG TPA: DNA mismatch repair protein MutS [Bacteroidales bacterium]|nr:DNA mismatch repair protein MutS [Bacteroidales bacterium]HQI46089.1 DNA mismatch repair protein MutS [Bacteroidales bacterium]
MKQYLSIKAKYPDAILLFRVGDFYETFSEDAIKTSGILGIVLTRRANGTASSVELAGFPYHALDTYLPKLVKAGHRVAICDQMEDPKLTKTIVKREITEVITPGVSLNDKILDHQTNNFLASIHLGDKISGISFLDISTGEFLIAQGKNDYIDKLIQSFQPNEVVVQKNKLPLFKELFGEKFYLSNFDDWVFTKDFSYELLTKHFGTNSLKGFGVEDFENGIIAAGAALHYLFETQHNKIQHISKLSRIEEDHYVWLDKFTIRNLELLHSPHENSRSLIDIIDHTISPMGSRMMKRWIVLPLKDKSTIDERLNIVEYFINNNPFHESILKEIKRIGDMERIISKVAVGKISPREVVQLSRALEAIETIKDYCEKTNELSLLKIAEQLNPCHTIRDRINKEINPEPPALLIKGNVINEGVNNDLDELRNLSASGKDYLLQLQQREIERTGIPSLKVAFNNVFGYYLEVTNTHKDKVPPEWHRKQTLVNAERYITEELKIYEEKILGAEEKIASIENQIYNNLIIDLVDYIKPIQLNASLIARLDCHSSFATLAIKHRYCRPELDESFIIDIKKGRHPVIEQQLPTGETYIANDVFLNNDQQQILIITGPNMSGKSALLRQTALIVLLAQMGSFVPAESAQIGIIDKIFTRVGASDNISSGESTFMVEMNETASILNNISNKSLILLDEIGRGTSTYDGISIAWAIAEFLHEHPLFKAKTLFATHYHELNEMASSMNRIKNFHVSIKEINNKVIFLRKLIPGGAEHSFGIHVAKMAGMPTQIIDRAHEIMLQIEKSHSNESLFKRVKEISKKAQQLRDFQLSFIQLNDPLLEQIKQDILNTDIDTLTPVEALLKLNEIKKLLGK